MKLIKSSLIVLGLFFMSNLNAQVLLQHSNALEPEQINLNEIKDISIIEVSISDYKNNYAVTIDYGQKSPSKIQVIIDKSTENMMDFNSKMHVVNYFESNGWLLTDINSEAENSYEDKTTYFFRKK